MMDEQDSLPPSPEMTPPPSPESPLPDHMRGYKPCRFAPPSNYDMDVLIETATHYDIEDWCMDQYLEMLMESVDYIQKQESKPVNFDQFDPQQIVRMKAVGMDHRPIGPVRLTQAEVVHSLIPYNVAKHLRRLCKAELYKREIERRVVSSASQHLAGYMTPRSPIIRLPEGEYPDLKVPFERPESPLSLSLANNMHLWFYREEYEDQEDLDEEEERKQQKMDIDHVDQDYMDYSQFANHVHDDNFQNEETEEILLSTPLTDGGIEIINEDQDVNMLLLDLPDRCNSRLEDYAQNGVASLEETEQKSPETCPPDRVPPTLPETTAKTLLHPGPLSHTQDETNAHIAVPVKSSINKFPVLPSISDSKPSKGTEQGEKRSREKSRKVKSSPKERILEKDFGQNLMARSTLPPISSDKADVKPRSTEPKKKKRSSAGAKCKEQSTGAKSPRKTPSPRLKSPVKKYSSEDIHTEINQWFGHNLSNEKPVKVYSSDDIKNSRPTSEISHWVEDINLLQKSPSPKALKLPPIAGSSEASLPTAPTPGPRGILVHPDTYARKVSQIIKKKTKHVSFASSASYIPTAPSDGRKESGHKYRATNAHIKTPLSPFKSSASSSRSTSTVGSVLQPETLAHLPKPPTEKKPMKGMRRRHFKTHIQLTKDKDILKVH